MHHPHTPGAALAPPCQWVEGTLCQVGLCPGCIQILLQLEKGTAENLKWEVTTAPHHIAHWEEQPTRRKPGEGNCWLHFCDPNGQTLGVCVMGDLRDRDHHTLINWHQTLGCKQTKEVCFSSPQHHHRTFMFHFMWKT